MSDPNTAGTPKTVNYQANSRASKKSDEVERRTPETVVVGGVVERKKSLGAKFREQFAGDDAKTVGTFLLLDVIIPATKNLIFDLGNEGLKRALFGGNYRSNIGGIASALGSRTVQQYQAYARPTAGPSSQIQPQMSQQQRATHDFSNVILSTREEALNVIDQLSSLIDDYGTATLNDFYACIGESGDFTAIKYGWKSMSQAQVRGIREGYLLELPKPVLLE